MDPIRGLPPLSGDVGPSLTLELMTAGASGWWPRTGNLSSGDAGYYGSMGGQYLNAPTVGVGQTLGDGTFTKPTPTTILTSGSSG